jgi:RNA polymerase sigma-70 factor, ECF subfamily
MEEESLLTAFLEHLPEGLQEAVEDHRQFEKRLEKVIDEASGEWPGIALDRMAFVRYLASMFPVDVAPEKTLQTLRTADLFIACACAHGDEKAIIAAEKRFAPTIEWALARMGVGAPG